MAGKAGLKAGLIGAAVLLVLVLLSLIPVPALNCICCGVQLIAYLGIGVLGGFFLAPPRSALAGAGAGAIAGLISGLVAAVAQTVVMAIQAATTDRSQLLSMLDPEMLRQLSELGIDLDTFTALTGTGGVALASVMCCAGSLALGAALGAAGGAILAAAKHD